MSKGLPVLPITLVEQTKKVTKENIHLQIHGDSMLAEAQSSLARSLRERAWRESGR